MIFEKTILYESIFNKKTKELLEKKYNLIKISNFKKNKFSKSVEAIFTKLGMNLDKNYLKKYENLSCIISPTTGLTHIDLKYCKKKKIKIINLKSSDKEVKKINATAEFNLILILCSIRKPHNYFDLTKKKIWNRYYYEFNQFDKYLIGIVGQGRIGKKLKKYLNLLNFKVRIYDKKKHERNVLDKLLKQSDVITFNINYDEKNFNFLNNKILNKCKKNVKIINTSRGEIIDEISLIKFLKKNKSAEAYLDCIKNEHKKYKDSPIIKNLSKLHNLYVTPHVSGACHDAIMKTEEIVVRKFLNYEKNKKL